MTRPLLLDLFCGAGGCAMGYHRAGFDVVGVDNRPMPRYPFAFVQADALEYLAQHGRKFDVIHASPPCQAHTTMSNRHRGAGGLADERTNLLTPTLEILNSQTLIWVVENVPGARRLMPSPITLHGGMFDLEVQRPRLFSSDVLLLAPTAPQVKEPIGVYGKAHDGRRLFDRANGTIQRAAASLEEAREAMGIDWMTWPEIREAIPPAYTAFLGRQLLRALGKEEPCSD